MESPGTPNSLSSLTETRDLSLRGRLRVLLEPSMQYRLPLSPPYAISPNATIKLSHSPLKLPDLPCRLESVMDRMFAFLSSWPQSSSGLSEQVAKETKKEVGKRSFYLVDSREDQPDLVVSFTADRKRVCFEIMEEDCRKYGLTHLPVEVEIGDPEKIRRILRGSADFYWHLHRSSQGSPLAGKVNLGCMKLEETGEDTDDLEEVLMPNPNGDNLNVGGVIMVDVDEDAIYGFKITNTTGVPLYVSMFYFDISDLSISQPGYAKKHPDVSLPPHGSLTIGYGVTETVPHTYTLREGQDVNVGFLKLFFSTKYMDLSGVVQKSAFDNPGTPPSGASLNCPNWFTTSHGTTATIYDDGYYNGRRPKRQHVWHTMCVAVVQTKGGGVS